MRKKLLFGFFTIISLTCLLSIFSMNNVYAATGNAYCDYNSIDWSSPDGGPYDGTTAYASGSKVYDQPAVITYNGSQPVYEKTLSTGDFTVTQHWYQQQYYKVYQKYYYVSISSPSCTDTYTYYTGNHDPAPNATGTDTLSSSVLSLTTSGSKQSGTLAYTASYSGGSTTVNTYWVKSVSVTSGTSNTDVYIDQYSDSHTCTLTYGDGSTRNCDQGTMNTTASDNLANTVASQQESTMSSEITQNLTAFWTANSNNGPLTNPTGYATRISAGALQMSQDNATGGFSGGNQVNNGTVGQYTAKFGNLDVFAYVDQYTGAQASAYVHSWHAATVDVEDETRSPNKKEVYAQQRVWNGGQEYRKPMMTDVTCKEWFYGPLSPKDCIGSVTPNENYYDRTSPKHVDGQETLDALVGGRTPTPGNAYRYIQYYVSVQDGTYTFEDTDYRTILYATKVQVNSGYMTIDPAGVSEPTQEYSPPKDSIVLETNTQITPSGSGYTSSPVPKDYPTHEDYVWHAYDEIYDNFTPPTCSRSYAPSKINGSILTEDCSSDVYRFYADPTGANQYDRMAPKEYWYKLGNTQRDEQIGYLENGLWAYQTYTFHYVTNVNITINPQKTYQDQPYPSITCTKTYDITSLSCLDKMYVSSDSGQNQNMGGTRQISFQYANNTHSDTETMQRVYANSTSINGPTSGKSGFRAFYQSYVNWQDGTRKDISLIPGVWDMKVSSTGEHMPYIGSIWSYTDTKGKSHGTSAINELYIPDPIANHFDIYANYPISGPYSDGLSGYAYVGDTWAPVSNSILFNLIGIQSITMQDVTSYVDPIDVDNTGKTVSSYPTISAAPFAGMRSAPGFGGYAFNNKTYQTGSWYDFQTTINWSDGTSEIADYSTHPELTWRFMNLQGNWSFNPNDYPATTTTNMPYSGLDTRLMWKNNWQPIRFDLFSEDNIPKPSGQENYNFAQTYIIGNAWAHEPTDLVITGPTSVSDPTATQSYQSWLNWGDAVYMNQSGQVFGSNTNPWGNLNRTEVTDQSWTKWFKDTTTENTPSSGPFQTSFPEFKANNHYRTIASSWGDQHRTLPGFQYWDYYYSQINVYFNGGTNPPNCDPNVPSMGCSLPIDNGGNNYRMPKNNAIPVNRMVEQSIALRAEGVSTGSGE